MTENSGVNITVGTSGTGGGFKKFCEGETDRCRTRRGRSRTTEKAACAAKGIAYEALAVANDALTVVASTENAWARRA